ncbi:MAG: response regulator [Ruminiclostridium sp.]
MRIFAVDDEKLVLESLVSAIKAAVPEAEVHSFQKPSEAIEKLQQISCDVAFLDIKMRGMTGLELARRMKEIQGDINIVFATGYSEYTLEAFRLYASDYLLKPVTPDMVARAMENLRNPVKRTSGNKLKIRCFGNFEVFADDKPVMFKRAKAKEVLAYLVDRMGSTCTMGEIMSVIWEDGVDNSSRHSNLRNLIFSLKRTLAEVGAEDVIVKGRNTISIDCDKVDCDYYDFLRQIPYAVNSYHGEYMSQYSWAEITTASLPILTENKGINIFHAKK